MTIPRFHLSASLGAKFDPDGAWVRVADLHMLREWTGWAIEYRNGDFYFVDHTTYAKTRQDAWEKWAAETEVSASERWKAEQRRDRRAGKYRAIKMSLMAIDTPVN